MASPFLTMNGNGDLMGLFSFYYSELSQELGYKLHTFGKCCRSDWAFELLRKSY